MPIAMTADSFKLNCEDAIAANLDDTTLDPAEVGYVALTIAEMREIHEALRVALEADDRAAEQSRNESLRVQRLVGRVKELEGALRWIIDAGHERDDGSCIEFCAACKAEQALKGGAR